MATCSSILAWEIPWTKEADGLQSMGSQRHNLATTHNNKIISLRVEYLGCFLFFRIYELCSLLVGWRENMGLRNSGYICNIFFNFYFFNSESMITHLQES